MFAYCRLERKPDADRESRKEGVLGAG